MVDKQKSEISISAKIREAPKSFKFVDESVVCIGMN